MNELERIIPERLPWYMKHLYRLHMARYEFAGPYVRGKSVLDLGCGVGYGCLRLADAGGRCVVGMDISHEAINYAKRHYQHPLVEYVVGDVTRAGLPDGSVEVAVSFETIEHLPIEKAETFVRELKRVMTPEGVALLSTPNGEVSYELGAFHTQEFTPNQLAELLTSHFSTVTYFGQRLISNWFVTMSRRMRTLSPALWRLDAFTRRLLFASSRITPLPVDGKQPMFLLAECRP